MTRLLGRHTLKVGADWRTIGIKTQSFAGSAGDFRFDRLFTSQNPTTPVGGNSYASFLLGYQSGDPANLSRVAVSNPFNAFVHYYGAYAQDDFRINTKTTLNFGLRLEHETGLMEENDSFTVAFDRTLNPGGQLGSRINPATGQAFVGGLVYAGVNGANTYQGDPPAVEDLAARRAGPLVQPQDRAARRLWDLLGAVELSGVGAANYGQIGFSRSTFSGRTSSSPTCPSPIRSPAACCSRLETRWAHWPVSAARSSSSIRPRRRRSCISTRSTSAVSCPETRPSASSTGSTGRDLGLGGSNDGIININQVDPRIWRSVRR